MGKIMFMLGIDNVYVRELCVQRWCVWAESLIMWFVMCVCGGEKEEGRVREVKR